VRDVVITKSYTTETAHIVRKAYTRRCRENIHGHMYQWEISLAAEPQANGMVVDFGDMQEIKALIDLFDHALVLWEEEDIETLEFLTSHFNRVLIMKQNCTAEHMAQLVFHYVSQIVEIAYGGRISVAMVSVHETRSGQAAAFADEGTEHEFAYVGDQADVDSSTILFLLPAKTSISYIKKGKEEQLSESL